MNAKVDPLKTQNPQTVHVDKQGRMATCTAQWLLEKSASHRPVEDNRIQTFICAKDSFGQLAVDMEAAQNSIEMVCLGFDPGMAFVRNQSNPAFPWANGEPIGELLRRKAAQGVTVRLLVWFNGSGSAVANNLVGYAQTDYMLVPGRVMGMGGIISSTWDEQQGRNKPTEKPVSAQRLDYCTHWWRDAVGGFIENLEVRWRDGEPAKVHASVADEADPPSSAGGMVLGWFDEAKLVKDYAVHHQKPVLIDYSHEEGRQAVGYVTGINSLTDYWDSTQHEFDSPEREVDRSTPADWKTAAGKGYWIDPVVVAAHQAKTEVSMRPLQDYASRIQGSALHGLHLNFATAWNRAQELPKMNDPKRKPRTGFTRTVPVHNQPMAKLQHFARPGPGFPARLQVLRTQPQESYTDAEKTWPFDKSIKHAYFQATSFARNYIYIENQYFFYEEWARHLKANRQAFMDWVQQAGKDSKDARLLHLMVVMPLPENKGMVPRTYDTVRSLGHAELFDGKTGQHQYVQQEQKRHADVQQRAQSNADHDGQPRPVAPLNDVVQSALKVKTPTLDEEGVLMQDGKSLGLKVLVCKMVTPNTSGNAKLGAARDIYIHSKLLMVDDNYMTLGSANLSQRSMAADSELNVATDSKAHNSDLRKRVWALQTGGLYDGGAGTPTPKEMIPLFMDWEKLAQDNAKAISDGTPFKVHGHLVIFNDSRRSSDRVG